MKTFSAISSVVFMMGGYVLFAIVLAGVAGLPPFDASIIQTTTSGTESLTPLAVYYLVFGALSVVNSSIQQLNKKD